MICWYCHWGWPQQVADIYDRAAKDLGSEAPLHFGPAHIVWEDENFEARDILWCIKEAHTNRSHYKDISDTEMAIVVRSVEELLALPKEIRECEPEDYDEEHPENYPPPPGLVMAKR